ncbi:MAG: hypothetical protein ABJH08_06270 [Balneola sp.]
MKNVTGGGCRIAWRNSDGSFAGYSAGCGSSSQQAEGWYNDGYTNDSGQYVSGYCCSSCGTGQFSHATPCLQ